MLDPGTLIPSLCFLFFACSLPGTYSANVVTLGSIEVFNAHEWFSSKPTVYFHCQGEERKVFLPDVKKTHAIYTFKGEESWQPLTELPEEKCKRCGFYEKDSFKSDDVFDEWELCPSDFPGGKYFHFKENEFNATFVCPNCTSPAGSEKVHSQSKRGKGKVGYLAILCVAVSLVAMAGMVAAYKYWQRRKREQDQARFLKLFDDGDDIEDELGLDPVL